MAYPEYDQYGIFEGHYVSAISVSDFVERFFRKDRLALPFYQKRGGRNALIVELTNDLQRSGHCWIGEHESITGEVVAFCDGKMPNNGLHTTTKGGEQNWLFN